MDLIPRRMQIPYMVDITLNDVLVEDIELLKVLEIIFQMFEESGFLPLRVGFHKSTEITRLCCHTYCVRTIAEESLTKCCPTSTEPRQEYHVFSKKSLHLIFVIILSPFRVRSSVEGRATIPSA